MSVFVVAYMTIQRMGVLGVFSTDALAQEAKNNAPPGASLIWVELLELDQTSTSHTHTLVRMARDGTVTQVWQQVSLDAPGFRTFDRNGNLVWEAETPDRETGIRIVDEERRRFIRENTWGKNPIELRELPRRQR